MPFSSHRSKWVQLNLIMLFTHNVKKIKSAAHKNGDADGTCVNEPLFRVQNIECQWSKTICPTWVRDVHRHNILKRKQNKHHQQFFHLISIPSVAPERTLVSFDGFVDQHMALQFVFTVKRCFALLARKRLLSCKKKNKQNSVTSFYGNSIVWSPVLYGHDFGRSHIYYGQKSFSIDVFCSCYCVKNHISFTVRCVNRLTVKMRVNCK